MILTAPGRFESALVTPVAESVEVAAPVVENVVVAAAAGAAAPAVENVEAAAVAGGSEEGDSDLGDGGHSCGDASSRTNRKRKPRGKRYSGPVKLVWGGWCDNCSAASANDQESNGARFSE